MLPSVAAGASFNWQYPASLVGFDPILLSCAKKNGVDRQEEVAQRKPLRRVFSGLFPKRRGCCPSDSPGLPGTDILPAGSCFVLLSGCWSGVRQTCETRLGAKQISSGNFFVRELRPLRWGPPSPNAARPARIFAEQKCLAAVGSAMFAARQVDR